MDTSPNRDAKSAGVSVIVPVFECRAVEELCSEILKVLAGTPCEVILVDDGSTDDSWANIQSAYASFPEVSAIRLARNSGQHQALLAGIRHADYEISVTIDDDFDQDPADIPKLISKLVDSNADVVYGSRLLPREWRKSSRGIVSTLFRVVLGRLVGVPMFRHFGPFRAFKTKLRDNFHGYRGGGASIDALLSWGASRVDFCSVSAVRKPLSHSRYSTSRLLALSLDVIVLYSRRPATAVIGAGLGVAVAALGILGYVIIRTLSVGATGTGFAFLASVVTFFAATQMLFLGFLMAYVSRAFEVVVGRPGYVISEVLLRKM